MKNLRLFLLISVLIFSRFGLGAESGKSTEAFDKMHQSIAHYLDMGGEVVRMTMVQKNAEGKVLKTNHLITVTRAVGDRYQTVILVKDDGTLFFAEQVIASGKAENQSWMYIPPVPGVKNSGKVFKVNRNTLQQAFIGSDFDVVDLERINIYDGESYLSGDEGSWIQAESDRYGERRIWLDEHADLQQIHYLRKGSPVKKSVWSGYENHRPTRIQMQRLRREKVVHLTEIQAEYQRGIEVPDLVFDRQNIQAVRKQIEELEALITP